MKTFYSLFLLALPITASGSAEGFDDPCFYVEPCMTYCSTDHVMKPYLTVGCGAVFPTKHSTSQGNSSSVLYSPTIPGISLFSLPNVRWENKYEVGFEVNAAVGCSLMTNWRVEGEFLYQNLERKISGHYDWRELNAVTMIIFDENSNDPVQHASKTANLYCLLSNIYNDFKNHTPWTFSVGGGVGVAWLESQKSVRNGILNIQTTTPPVNISAPTTEKSPSLYGTALAWQIKLGLSYNMRENFSLGLNYRLFGTTKFQASHSMIITNPNTPVAATFEIPQSNIRGFINNSINISLTYNF